MKVKQKKSALLPGLITVLMVVAAVAGGLRMTDPDGGRLDTMRQELETITAENEGLTAQVEALRTETAEQKALPEAIQKQKDEGFRLLGELERQIRAGESDKRIAYLTFDDGPYDNTTDAILDILKEKGLLEPVMKRLMERMEFYVDHRSGKSLERGILTFSLEQGVLGESSDVRRLIACVKAEIEQTESEGTEKLAE